MWLSCQFCSDSSIADTTRDAPHSRHADRSFRCDSSGSRLSANCSLSAISGCVCGPCAVVIVAQNRRGILFSFDEIK